MSEIEHEIISHGDGKVILGEDFPSDQFLVFEGCASRIKVVLDESHLQSLCNQLNEWGYKPEK